MTAQKHIDRIRKPGESDLDHQAGKSTLKGRLSGAYSKGSGKRAADVVLLAKPGPAAAKLLQTSELGK